MIDRILNESGYRMYIFNKYLFSFIEGELSPKVETFFRYLIRNHKDCQKEYSDYKRIINLSKQLNDDLELEIEAPQGLKDKLKKQFEN